MNFSQLINKSISKYIESYPFSDITIAKVVSVNPISIQLANNIQPIYHQSIKLTNSVIEKTIDIVEHKHKYFDSDTGEGASGSKDRETEVNLQNVQVYENGIALGRTKDRTKIIINKGLEVGENVLVLKVKQGQQFIILSRLYDNIGE